MTQRWASSTCGWRCRREVGIRRGKPITTLLVIWAVVSFGLAILFPMTFNIGKLPAGMGRYTRKLVKSIDDSFENTGEFRTFFIIENALVSKPFCFSMSICENCHENRKKKI